MSRGLRAARLLEGEGPGKESDLLPSEQSPSVHRRYSERHTEATKVALSRKKAKSDHSRLSSKVVEFSAKLARASSMLSDCQPDVTLEEDMAISPPMPVLIPE